MIKKLLVWPIVTTVLISCASWFTSGTHEAPNDPIVGSRSSSDFIFGQAEPLPADADSTQQPSQSSANAPNASASSSGNLEAQPAKSHSVVPSSTSVLPIR